MKNKKLLMIIFVLMVVLISIVIIFKKDDISNIQSSNFSNIQIGDYVEYDSDLKVNAEWRVWTKNDKEIVIIPTQPLGDVSLGVKKYVDGDEDKKFLEALNDYNTAVEQIEAECDKYTSSKLGIKEEDIRSLTIEDVEKSDISELAIKKYTENIDLLLTAGFDEETREQLIVELDKLKEYTVGEYFAAQYNEETQKNEILSSFIEATEANPVILKQDNYSVGTLGWKILPNSTDTYGDLIGKKLSWLASPMVGCTHFGASFGVFEIGSSSIGHHQILGSTGEYGGSLEMGVRPLITLKAENLTTQQNDTSDGSKDYPWIIVGIDE